MTNQLDSQRLLADVDHVAFAKLGTMFHRALTLAHRAEAARSLRGRSLLAWSAEHLPHHFHKSPSPLHVWLAGELDSMREARATKLNLIGPRGSAKSTVATLAYVLRVACEATEPYIWIVSDTRHQAGAHLENIKSELIENRSLAEAYPGAVGQGSVWRSGAIVLANRVMIEAFGAGQKVRGRRRLSHRPSLVICDDLQNDEHANSKTRREHCRAWFQGGLLQVGTSATNYVHLATALHREALALELERTPGWLSRRFAAIVHWPRDIDLWRQWKAIYCDLDRSDARAAARTFFETHRAAMSAGAEVLWPESEDLYTLMALRAQIGPVAFEREKQSSPINAQQCEFVEEYFDDTIWFDDWPSDLRMKVMALDPSKGASDDVGDYSAFALLGVDRAGVLYVQADLVRRPIARIVSDGVLLAADFRPDALGVEANQFQELLAGEFAAEFVRQGVPAVEIWLLQNTTSKRLRIRSLAPYLSQRRLRFKAGCPSTRLLVDQLRDYPLGDHDDGPDALEMAIRLASAIDQGREPRDALGDRIRLSV